MVSVSCEVQRNIKCAAAGLINWWIAAPLPELVFLGRFGSTASWIRSNYPHVYFGPGHTALLRVIRSIFDETTFCILSLGKFLTGTYHKFWTQFTE